MRRLTAFALAAVLGVAVAVGLASCGGGEDARLLPGETARDITANLDAVKQLVDEGECVGAADAAQQVSAQVEALGGVDEKLKQALQKGAVRLGEVVATCEEATTEALAPSSVPETTEGPAKEPPGQGKKEEKEEEKAEKEVEKAEKEEKAPPTPPVETTPETPPVTPPPSESGGTGAPGGVSPGSPVGEGE